VGRRDEQAQLRRQEAARDRARTDREAQQGLTQRRPTRAAGVGRPVGRPAPTRLRHDTSRNTRLLAGIVAAPLAFAALYTAFRLFQSAWLARRSEPLQVAPPEPKKRLLIVGDSTGVGTGASTAQTSLAGLIAAEHPNLTIVNRAADGATFERIAAQLEGGGRFDAVLILGGSHDAMRLTGAEGLRRALSRVLFLARARSDTVVLMPAGNLGNAPFFLWPWSLLMTQRSRLLQALARQAAAANGASYVDLFNERAADPFAQEPKRLRASDRLHPSDAGYALWHRELAAQSGLAGALR
jgi:lysophospholipase L1-like esterase